VCACVCVCVCAVCVCMCMCMSHTCALHTLCSIKGRGGGVGRVSLPEKISDHSGVRSALVRSEICMLLRSDMRGQGGVRPRATVFWVRYTSQHAQCAGLLDVGPKVLHHLAHAQARATYDQAGHNTHTRCAAARSCGGTSCTR